MTEPPSLPRSTPTDEALPPPGEGVVASVVDSAVAEVEELAAVRSRRAADLTLADRMSAALLGGGFVAVAVALAAGAVGPGIGGGGLTPGDAVRHLLLVVLYALAARTEFESGTGSAVPTEPVLVAILFGVPLPLVPVVVLAGLQLGALGDAEPGAWWYRVTVRASSGWHCLGPLVVLWWAAPGPPSLRHWPVYAMALVAQFAVDGTVAATRSLALGSGVRPLVRPMSWTFAVDAMLAPVGLCAVVAAAGSPAVDLLVLAPLGLIALLARDRATHLEQAVTLGRAVTEVRTEARVDPMTGVANRRAWDEALERAERERAECGATVVVVMADLDHLKRTNDRLGHDAGDRLIRAAADALVAVAPAGATVGRLGGDEFGVLVVGVDDPALGAELAARVRVRAAASEPAVSISLGSALADPAPGSPTVAEAAALADADAGLDKARRRAGRDDAPVDFPTPVDAP